MPEIDYNQKASSTVRFANLGTTTQTVKNSSGNLVGFIASNPGASATYFCFYNNASPIIGTTTALVQVLVPAGQCVNMILPQGVFFSNAITIAATDITSPTNGNPPAVGLVVSIFFS